MNNIFENIFFQFKLQLSGRRNVPFSTTYNIYFIFSAMFNLV